MISWGPWAFYTIFPLSKIIQNKMDDVYSQSFLIKLFIKKIFFLHGLLFGVKRWTWSDVSRIIILPYHVLVHYIVSFLGVSREPQTNLWEIKESYSYIIWHNLKRHSPPKKINFPTTWIHNFSNPIETSLSFYPPPPS